MTEPSSASLEVTDLRVEFATPSGTLTAVDGVSLTLAERSRSRSWESRDRASRCSR